MERFHCTLFVGPVLGRDFHDFSTFSVFREKLYLRNRNCRAIRETLYLRNLQESRAFRMLIAAHESRIMCRGLFG